ncbi:hypothetical protein [Marinimicrobium sp. ABcell2]|uniref:hypothetical protein n=1 Tax=Marinimicrobium sp. ABcell2 TaxID=3069751 RepID=UPI0027B0A378|nr:hypothetical protein [Marinimicrobium sp. ABcell2]MDQ2075835.1 hypothetical protein [Marinimicrobium sp. ABcell2]
MPLRHTLRARICQFRMSPNYPLGDFVDWANEQELDKSELLKRLDELQTILDLEAEALRRHGQSKSVLHLVQQEYWCFYCEQIRAYYRTLLKHPECAGRLAVIRRMSHERKPRSL